MADICRYDFIEYGDYKFDGFVKTSASIQPVMADDGYTAKYHRVTFQCEFIINHETVSLIDPIGGGVDLQMDEIRRTLTTSGLRLLVSYRGLGSHSTITSGSGIDVLKTVDEASLLEGPFPELLDWEPIVGNQAVRCVWKVSYIKQRCEDHYDNQLLKTYSLNLDKDGNLTDVVDLFQSISEEQELSINESGAITITLTGYLEFAGLINSKKDNGINSARTGRQALRVLASKFETDIPLGYQRKSKYKFLKDSRSVTYTVTDTEIESDNVIFPYIIKADVTHEVSSSLMSSDLVASKGFLQWMNSFDGTFTVRPGVWKGWAWIAFLVYLFNRRSRATDQLPAGMIEEAKDEKDAAVPNVVNKKRNAEPKQLPISIRIKEHLLSRQVDISMKYLVTCSMAQLFEATGLFYPITTLWNDKKVVTPNPNGPPTITLAPTQFPNDIGTTPISPISGSSPISQYKQWYSFYEQSQRDLQNIYGYRTVNLPFNTLIYDSCEDSANDWVLNRGYKTNGHSVLTIQGDRPELQPPPPPTTVTSSTTYQGLGTASTGSVVKDSYDTSSNNYKNSDYMSTLKPRHSWISRNDSIMLVEDTNAKLLPSIEAIGNDHLNASKSANAELAEKNRKGFNISGRSTGFDQSRYGNHKSMAYGLPVYYIRSTGYALRAGYGIQCPVIRGVYLNTNVSSLTDLESPNNLLVATRIGVNKWTHKQVAQSVDIPIYMAMWDVTYVLQGDPTRANIVYSTNSAAEYV